MTKGELGDILQILADCSPSNPIVKKEGGGLKLRSVISSQLGPSTFWIVRKEISIIEFDQLCSCASSVLGVLQPVWKGQATTQVQLHWCKKKQFFYDIEDVPRATIFWLDIYHFSDTMEQLPETEIIQSRSSFITVDDYVLPHSHMSFLSQTIIKRDIMGNRKPQNLWTMQECKVTKHWLLRVFILPF